MPHIRHGAAKQRFFLNLKGEKKKETCNFLKNERAPQLGKADRTAGQRITERDKEKKYTTRAGMPTADVSAHHLHHRDLEPPWPATQGP